MKKIKQLDNGRYIILGMSYDGRKAVVYDKTEKKSALLVCEFGRFYTQCVPSAVCDICIALDRPEGGRINLQLSDLDFRSYERMNLQLAGGDNNGKDHADA